MKSILAALILILTAQMASADVVHPAIGPNQCTPTRPLQDTRMSCVSGDISYTITIKSLGSPLDRGCDGDKYYESKSAVIETYIAPVAAGLEPLRGHIELYSGTFNYSLSGGYFTAKDGSIDLSSCVTPLNEQPNMHFDN